MITRSVIKSKLTKKRKKKQSHRKKILKPQHRLIWDTALNIFNRPLIQSTGFVGAVFHITITPNEITLCSV